MAGYGGDVTVFVEDKAGDQGGPGSPAPWWISPDVDIPAHTGEAAQGSNDVQIRVHAHEEPMIEEKIVAEVYVGAPGFVLSPTTGTKRIDPGNLLFRPSNVVLGSEPVTNLAGVTRTFPWTPSSSAGAVDGPGHRCLIVRAFPQNVQPPTTPFDVANEGHEAQRNIEVLSTTKVQMDMSSGGAGTPDDPRRRDKNDGMWWERFFTMAVQGSAQSFVLWAFDPHPNEDLVETVRPVLEHVKFQGFSEQPPEAVSVEPEGDGTAIDPTDLLGGPFMENSGIGNGLFAKELFLGAAALELEEDKLSSLVLRFDHSHLEPGTAVVLHGAQWHESGRPEGGMTVIAMAPLD